MKKENGFTVVELIASFALTMVISIFLFEVLIDVKDIFVETAIKTNVQEKLAIISKNIKYNIQDGSNIQCSNNVCTNNGQPLITVNDTNVIVAGQTYNMPKDGDQSIQIKDPKLISECESSDCYLSVYFKLTSPNLSKDYEYNVVYYYTTS